MSASVPPPSFVPPPSGSDPAPVGYSAPATPDRRRRPSRRSLGAAGLGLAAAVLAIVLLFGTSSNPTVDPIAQAATVSSNAPGYRMHMSISMTSSAFSGPITAYGDGVADPRDHAASMSLAVDFSALPQAAQALGGAPLRIDMIIDGPVMYLKLPQALLSAAPSLGDKPWFKMNIAKSAGLPGLSSLGSDTTTGDPRQILQYLRAASDDVTNEGQQRVDGVQTTHYHAELNLGRLGTNVPAAEQRVIQQALAKLQHTTGSADLPVDVWVDAHQLVRRIAMSLSLHLPGGQSLHQSMVADLTDYGPQPRPVLPPADQVQDATGLLSGANPNG